MIAPVTLSLAHHPKLAEALEEIHPEWPLIWDFNAEIAAHKFLAENPEWGKIDTGGRATYPGRRGKQQ